MTEQDKNETRPQPPVDPPRPDHKPEPVKAQPAGHDDDFYVEPVKMRGKDVAGIVVALVALAVIGYAGYIWLNPSLGYGDVIRLGKSAPLIQSQQPAAGKSEGGSSAATDTNEASGGTEAAGGSVDTTCAYCGMPAERSMSYVIATWDDGMASHHDSWDCLFKYGKQSSMQLVSAQVLDYASPAGEIKLLDAAQAYYLYDTEETIAGSMPPYVAAFKVRADAEASRAQLGGEVVDFTRLKEKWLQGSK